MLIDKHDIPEVAIDEMNKTHANEVDIINRLFDLITLYQSGQPIDNDMSSAIEQFAAHVETHFKREEDMMEEAKFPAFFVHKSEHDRVRTELSALVDFWQNDSDIEPLANYLEHIHPGWAKNHIATMDSMTALYILRAREATKASS